VLAGCSALKKVTAPVQVMLGHWLGAEVLHLSCNFEDAILQPVRKVLLGFGPGVTLLQIYAGRRTCGLFGSDLVSPSRREITLCHDFLTVVLCIDPAWSRTAYLGLEASGLSGPIIVEIMPSQPPFFCMAP
jgi:hypothetical protein